MNNSRNVRGRNQFYKFEKYGERPYIITGAALGLIGLALLVWFGITG